MARPTLEESVVLDQTAEEVLHTYSTSEMTVDDIAKGLGVSIWAVRRLLARARRNRDAGSVACVVSADQLDRQQRTIRANQEQIQRTIDGALGECKRTIEEQARQIAGLKKDGWSEW